MATDHRPLSLRPVHADRPDGAQLLVGPDGLSIACVYPARPEMAALLRKVVESHNAVPALLSACQMVVMACGGAGAVDPAFLPVCENCREVAELAMRAEL